VGGDETPGPTCSVFSSCVASNQAVLTSQPLSTVDPHWPHPVVDDDIAVGRPSIN